MEIIKISPCCRDTNFTYIHTPKDNWKTTRCTCKTCDKEFSAIDLINVEKGYNPTMYYCDKCHRTLEEEANKIK